MKTKLILVWTLLISASSFAQLTYVPDDVFEQALINLGLDDVLDDYVITNNINTLTNLNLYTLGIADLTGIEDFTALTDLDAGLNNLTNLDLSQNTALETLFCDSNQLNNLDLSQNSALYFLNCDNNTLEILNVKNGNNTNFTVFSALNNPELICIEVDDTAYSTTNWTVIDAQTSFSENCFTYVPDDNFEQALIDLGHDNILDDYVITSNISALTYLNVSDKAIADLTGIEDFIALTFLICFNNQLSNLDVSQNVALTYLSCSNNQLSNLDVSQNTALTELSCFQNELNDLNLTQNTALTRLYCSSNQLTNLDVSQNTLLGDLDCRTNPINNLNITLNTMLTYLHCANTQISSLNLSQNTALTELYCYDNQLTELDLFQNTALTELRCYDNQLTELDLSQNTALTELRCNNNQLTSLYIGNTALTYLSCHSNQLSNLDVSQNTLLNTLLCFNNQLSSLDVTQNTEITYLDCSYNQLTNLDVRNGNNGIIDTFFAYENLNLICINVDNAAYSTANWTDIDAQTNFSEDCATLSISENSLNVVDVSIYPNPTSKYININTTKNIQNIEIYDLLGLSLIHI